MKPYTNSSSPFHALRSFLKLLGKYSLACMIILLPFRLFPRYKHDFGVFQAQLLHFKLKWGASAKQAKQCLLVQHQGLWWIFHRESLHVVSVGVTPNLSHFLWMEAHGRRMGGGQNGLECSGKPRPCTSSALLPPVLCQCAPRGCSSDSRFIA